MTPAQPPPAAPARTPGGARLIGLAPALLFVVLAWPCLDENAATYDETEHVPAAYTYVTRHDYRLGPEHPPLVKMLLGLPLLGLPARVSPAAEQAFAAARRDIDAHWIFGDRFLFKDNAPGPILRRARAVALGLGALLVLVVFLWTRDAFGLPGALLAATAAALDPNLLAHGTLATTDVGFVLFFTMTLYGARRALRRLTPANALGTGLALAAAFASKHSAVLLLPILLLLGTRRVVSSRPWPCGARTPRLAGSRGARAAALLALLVLWGMIAWGGVWAAYGFRYAATADGVASLPLAHWTARIREIGLTRDHLVAGTPMPAPATLAREAAAMPAGAAERIITAAAGHRLVPEGYSFGLAFATAMAQVRRAFLLGEISLTGRSWYFPFALLVKTPLATLALLAVALALFLVGTRARRAGDRATAREALTALVPALVVVGAAMRSDLNIGYRHVLAAVPLLYVLAGVVPAALARLAGTRASAVVAGVALLGLAAETLAARPYFIPFFNAAAGGARGGLALLSDSNLDWGQGLPALHRWMRAHDVARINLVYFGTADPAAYDIAFVPLPGTYHLAVGGAGVAGHAPRRPEVPGYVAVSATHLQGTYLMPSQQRFYAFLHDREPIAVVADSIYVFRVERWGG